MATVIDEAVEIMQQATIQILSLRASLMSMKRRGGEFDPCWCVEFKPEAHEERCARARELVIPSPTEG